MAPPPTKWRKDDDDDDETPQSVIEDLDDIYTSSATYAYELPPLTTAPPSSTGSLDPGTMYGPPNPTGKPLLSKRPPHPPPIAVSSEPPSFSDSPYSSSKVTPWPDNGSFSPISTLSSPVSQAGASSSSTPIQGYDGGRPAWVAQHDKHNSTPMYAAAAVIPVVLLAIVGAGIFVCLRRRKRQKQGALNQRPPHQMTKRSTSVHQYMAPTQVIVPQYAPQGSQLPPTSTPSQLQPVILGPIPSGSNGAYLTGIDTSDMVSIASNNLRPAEQYAETNSLSEPPPPYRPNSVAPPSFYSTSRQSSVRSSDPPPTTSRTHLIERSPFDDAQDVDNVSEMSGPTSRRNDDTWSAVSDLSYQHDPFSDRRRYDL